jgi:hypothetical protein
MKFKSALISIAAICTGLATAGASAAPVNSTGDVTNNVIFGSGNANGSFTGTTQNNIEVALRGKIRGQGVYNYDLDHTYIFSPLTYPGTTTRSAYNFEWSINTNADGNGTNKIASFDYLLQIDTDPSVLTSFISGDPYATPYADHSFGDNNTAQSAGIEASPKLNGSSTPTEIQDAVDNFSLLKDTYNLSQQSWNMGFGDLNGFLPYLANPQQEGLYTIALSVLEKGTTNVLASTSIDIQYGATAPVPLPAGLPLLLSAFGGLALMRFRRRSA